MGKVSMPVSWQPRLACGQSLARVLLKRNSSGVTPEQLKDIWYLLAQLTYWFTHMSPCRSEREALNVNSQHRFEDALAAVTPRRTAALERMHLQKFQDEQIRQHETAAQVTAACDSVSNERHLI